MKSKILIVFFMSFIAFIITGCQSDTQSSIGDQSINITDIPVERPDNINVKEFDITAEKAQWKIKDQSFEAWTYNGTVPGEEIRVQEGDWLKVNLINKLDDPVTIHWHGVVLPNQMDGVAGVTQNAVQPGDTFTYEFQATEAGTYWYHSHQDSYYQVDRGLYGALIVESKEKTYDQDYVLMIDEWSMGNEGRRGMMGNNGTPGEMDSQMIYDTFTINGESYPDIDPIEVRQGEKIRLRVINAGYQKQVLYLNNHQYQVVANDGKKVNNSTLTSDVLLVAPGERIDIEFEENSSKDWYIDSPNLVAESADIKIPIKIIDGEGKNEHSYKDAETLQLIDYTEQGEMTTIIDQNQQPDLEYKMKLTAGMAMMNNDMAYKINGKTFPDTSPIKVNKGDLVKVTLSNNSMLDHPMHLHGHYFQVVSRNGKLLDKPLVKDLINIKPHEQYEILFIADNPGDWVFHCHDLIHATGGMVTVLKYNGYETPFELGGEYHNEPE
ncbi:hypothetical protein BFG57_16435 [Bacillus solimangrovi]|uniref:Copper oxidase n=1 Tax=Bacillus solimangrovi TaxID=1305675 RepID=A0A1E5LE85_9BACI|nr:hypothetical protein BFG57_16435 [Bacillus solimangrovi]